MKRLIKRVANAIKNVDINCGLKPMRAVLKEML